MQNSIAEYDVAKTTKATIMVEFHREGNELSAVRMASGGAADGFAAIAHVKQMMEQIAAFGEATTRRVLKVTASVSMIRL